MMEHTKEVRLCDLFKSLNDNAETKPMREIYNPENSEVRIYNNRKYLVRKKKKVS